MQGRLSTPEAMVRPPQDGRMGPPNFNRAARSTDAV